MDHRQRMLSSLPDNVIAAGNPCRVIRRITEKDRMFYYKDRLFDVNPWED